MLNCILSLLTIPYPKVLYRNTPLEHFAALSSIWHEKIETLSRIQKRDALLFLFCESNPRYIQERTIHLLTKVKNEFPKVALVAKEEKGCEICAS